MTRSWMRVIVLAFLCCATARVARADVFADANAAYARGAFEDAVRGYQRELDSGVVHEDVYYDLGNAYFRLGQLGPAIYNYERALLLAPDMSDARYNLAVARAAVAEKVRDRLTGAEADPRWVRVAKTFTISELTVFVVAANVLFFALLLVLRFLESGFRRSVLMVFTGFFGLVFAASLVLFGAGVYLREGRTMAVVLPDQVMMREGKSSDSAERGQLHAGLRVQVLEARSGWSRVRLSNGVEGWVPADRLGLL